MGKFQIPSNLSIYHWVGIFIVKAKNTIKCTCIYETMELILHRLDGALTCLKHNYIMDL